MTALGNSAPGLAASDSDVYTAPNLIYAGGPAPTRTAPGVTYDDLAQYSLVGRVTETGDLVLSNPGANDGSEVPVGVTTAAAVADQDSNSAVPDSNSLGGAARNVRYYLDGVFNYDALVKHANWTVDSLRRALEAAGANFGVEQPATATPTEPSGF